MSNLASEENAKKINQRFKELTTELYDLREAQTKNENSIAMLDQKLNTQMELYTKFFVQQYGTGSTEKIS